eukprot:6526111-Pyramimonas_sp.AAC.1
MAIRMQHLPRKQLPAFVLPEKPQLLGKGAGKKRGREGSSPAEAEGGAAKHASGEAAANGAGSKPRTRARRRH